MRMLKLRFELIHSSVSEAPVAYVLASFSSVPKLLYHVVENEQYGCHRSVLTERKAEDET